MARTSFLPSRGLVCALLLCFGFCLSCTFATVRIQTISEAKEDLLARQERATDEPVPATTGNGIFGNDSIIWNSTCFLMETMAVGITVQPLNRAVKSLDRLITANGTKSSVESSCSWSEANKTATSEVNIKFDNLDPSLNITDLSFKMEFAGDTFNWILSSLVLDISFYGASNHSIWPNVSLKTKELFASRETSYYCLNQPGFRGNFDENEVILYFRNLIIEPFVNDTSAGFSPIENCEYAFGIGIWMGILTALIMGVILGLGISMLASIRNMDRFDDPKTSKLLSVPSE